MKLKNICLGIACIAVVSACNDKMDYHEYTSYDKDYVFSDFSRTAGFVNNIYSYLDSDLPSYQSLASACDEAEMAVTYSSVLDYTNGAWSALNPKSLWGYYSGIRAANYFLEESKDLDFYDLRYAQDYAAQMNRFNRRKSLILLLVNVRKWRLSCPFLIPLWIMMLRVVPTRRPVVSRRELLWH